jgi:hypothetical protein
MKTHFNHGGKKFMSVVGLRPNTRIKKHLLNIIYATMKNLGCQQNGTSLLTSHGKSACDGVGGTKKACSKVQFALSTE